MQGETLISLTDGESLEMRGIARPHQGTPASRQRKNQPAVDALKGKARTWFAWLRFALE